MRTANVKMAMASHVGPPVSVFESMFQLRSDQRTDARPNFCAVLLLMVCNNNDQECSSRLPKSMLLMSRQFKSHLFDLRVLRLNHNLTSFASTHADTCTLTPIQN